MIKVVNFFREEIALIVILSIVNDLSMLFSLVEKLIISFSLFLLASFVRVIDDRRRCHRHRRRLFEERQMVTLCHSDKQCIYI